MLINEVKSLVESLSAKSSVGGYLPADEYSNYATLAQLRIINTLHERLDFNLNIITLLSDVSKTKLVPVNDQRFSRPSDYYKPIACEASFSDGQSDMEYIGLSERRNRINSDIVEPTLSYPTFTEDSTGFIADPVGISRVRLSYIFQPEDPVWAEVPDSVPPTFDPNNSTDFALSDKFTDILVNTIAGMFGIEIRDVNLQQATVQNLVQSLGQ